MTNFSTTWKAARKLLKKQLDGDTFERYIAGIVPVSIDVDKAVATLGVVNDFTALWLDSNYKEIIGDALAQVLQQQVAVEFEAGHADAVPPAKNGGKGKGKGKGKKQKTEAISVEHDERLAKYRPDFTFDSFVVGNNNRICVAAAQAVASKPGRAYNPLFIYGGTGLGKTHLLQAIAIDVVSRRKRSRVEYLSSEEFVNQYIEALQNKRLPSFRRHFRSLDLLLIDDVQFFEGKVGSSEEFFHTFNTLHNAHKQIVLASDRTPQEMNGLEKRLVSRFDWGLSAQILPPDLETRVAILKKKQEQQNVKISDEILFMIARNIRSNIRNLEGAVTTLIMNISAFGYEMTAERAQELLQDKFDNEATHLLTIDTIQRRVAEYYDIRLADMTSRKRPQNIARPRMVAMYLSRQLTGQSLPTIGYAFSRNHATILHAINKVERDMDKDAEFANSVNTLVRQLRQ
jgi:chromosomal replication initiator protein